MKPTQNLASRHPQRAAVGFTLIEMAIVLVLLSVLSIYTVPKVFNSSAVTLDSQAKSFASDLRRVQLLSSVRGISLCVKLVDNTHYSVLTQCAQSASTFIDPATGQPFQGQLLYGVIFQNFPNLPALEFNNLGQPSRAASYVIGPQSGSTASFGVNVTALTGYVTAVANP